MNSNDEYLNTAKSHVRGDELMNSVAAAAALIDIAMTLRNIEQVLVKLPAQF